MPGYSVRGIQFSVISKSDRQPVIASEKSYHAAVHRVLVIVMTYRRFELIEGMSAKFWEIRQRGKRTHVRFGRIGAKGQMQDKEHESTAAARAAAEKLIAQKQKKGYAEVTGDANGSSKEQDAGVRENPVVSADSIPRNRTLTFEGLLDPSLGGGGTKSGRERKWTFSARLVAWKVEGGPLVREKLDVISAKISDRQLTTRMKQFPKWGLVKFTARITERQPRGIATVKLVKYSGESPDKDLTDVKQEMSRPMTFEDRTLGTLTYNRQLGLFEGRKNFSGGEFNLWFAAESIDEAKALIRAAKPFLRAPKKRVKEYEQLVLKEYFEDCRESFLQYRDETLTTESFLALMEKRWLVTFSRQNDQIQCSISGSSSSLDLFGDHSMTAHGTLEGGLTEVYLEG